MQTNYGLEYLLIKKKAFYESYPKPTKLGYSFIALNTQKHVVLDV